MDHLLASPQLAVFSTASDQAVQGYMRFVCDSCRAQYMIDDDKVGAKGVKVRCKKCGYNIIVRHRGYQPPNEQEASQVPPTDAPPTDTPGPQPQETQLSDQQPHATASSNPPREHVFISYSHRDKRWLDRIQIHLKPLVRAQSIKVWSDASIKAGADWRMDIDTALAQTKVAVLLVSASFLASDFIVHHELPSLLNSNGVRVLWVPVSACSYESVGIDKYQAVLDPSTPLNRLHHAYVDEALVKVCRAIQQAYSTES